jgi:hypothetical protein
MNQSQVSPQLRIWQLGLGFANTAVLHALVKTGVIEQMRQHSRSLSELAQAGQLNSDMLYRALRFATVIGVVEQNDSQYSLTETGALLLKDVPGSVYMGILLIGSEPWQRGWENFAHSLATGDAAFDQAMGEPFFDYLDEHPEYGALFNQWQNILTSMAARAITEVYDFTAYGTICDVGGGQGVLLESLLSANPHLRGILYDQESVIKDHVLADLSQRVEIQSGNFFEHVPAAEVLIMKNVLHDWNDEKCQVILSRCRQAMQPSSRLLIVEMVIDSPADLMGVFYDMHMQVILGGKERTAGEFGALLQRAGMKLNRIIPTKSPVKILEVLL